jgi:CelD/BcsL family acetyltransferase involved in cellulose biosynthesis
MSAKAENCKQFLTNKCCDDHGCRHQRPNGADNSVVEAGPSRCHRYFCRSRPGRGDLARTRRTAESHTPYQRYDFVAAWQRQVGERNGVRPFIVIASDAEHRPLLLLPLALGRRHGINIANFMGGKHATFNMALWNGEFAASATRSDMEALISMVAQRGEADVLALH